MRRLVLLTATAILPAQTLPHWLKVGAEVRGRGEAFTSWNFVPGEDNSYYLHRLRLNAAIEPASWLRVFLQAQDSQAPGYRRPVPDNVADTLDVHQAYFEVGRSEGWSLRFGRQEMIFGEERLVGASNWSNTGRSFDAVRLGWQRAKTRLDWFASAVVVPVNGLFDRPRTANKLYGFYSTFGERKVLQPYFFWKTNTRVRGERGEFGDLDVLTWGARSVGKLPRRFDYSLETALQSGHSARDEIRAWAGHWVLGYALAKDDRAPRLVAEYNYASGDKDARDGRRGTFDQLYPTNHNKYGTGDRVGWRNIHDAMGGLEWRPKRSVRCNLDYHSFWLATRRDALYTEAGAVYVRNPNATSNHMGQEIDLQTDWRYSEHIRLGGGIAHLFPGRYLHESTRGGAVTAPYVMWTYSF